MLSIYFILLLFGGFFEGYANRSTHVQSQVHTHLSAVESGLDIPYHLWYLAKMAEAHEGLAPQLMRELERAGSQHPTHPVFCMLQNSGDAADTGAILYKAYQCTGSWKLLISALYESDAMLRATILREQQTVLETVGAENEVTYALINKAAGWQYDVTILFRERSFTLPDYYVFNGHTASADDQLESMIYQWEQELIQSSQISHANDALKLKTVVTGLHSRIGDYGRVHRLNPLTTQSNILSDIHPKQVMLKRFAFAATVGGYFQTALQIYRSYLLPLSEAITDDEEFLKVTIDYANILFRLGNVSAALQTYQEVYSHPWQIQDPRYQAALLNNMAVSYLNAGFFEQYVSLQLQSYEQAREGGAVQTQLRSLTNLYIYHWRNQDWANAIRFLDEALSLAQNQNFQREIAEIYILFSTYYSNHKRDFENALFYVDQALNVIDPDQGFNMLVSAYIEKASVLIKMQRYDEAIDLNRYILGQVVQRDDPRAEFDLNTQLVNLLIDNQQYDEASEIITWLRDVPLEYLSLQQRSLLTNSLVKYSRISNRDESELELLRDTVSEIIRAVRLSGDLQSGFIRLEQGYELSFSLLIDELRDAGAIDEAVVWLDEIKNLNKAAFVNSTLLKSSILTEDEFLYDVQLTNRIDRIRSEILRAGDERQLELNTELLQLLNEKNQFNNRILREYSTDQLSIRSLQRQLSASEQILSYQAIDSVMYIVSITRNEISLHRKLVDDKLVETASRIIEGLRNTTSNLHDLHTLYQELVSPYLSERTNRLFMIPDGFMYQIPVEILPRNRTDAPFQFGLAHYLIEDIAVSYQNSLSDLLRLKSRPRQGGFTSDYVGVGISNFDFVHAQSTTPSSRFTMGNLPFAKTEIEESYRTLDPLAHRLKFLDDEGTILNVIQNATNSRIIHIASHSLVYDTDPLFSVIQLYGGNSDENNGQLYAYELFSYNIRSELVVLSSCDSGAGSFVSGSGIIGLGRALTYAGVQSLVLNLWSIRDQAAANLMVNFYAHLGKNGNKDDALRISKLEFLNNTNSDPAVWGSLIVFGDPGPLFNPFPWTRAILLVILLTLASAVFYRYRK
jgi:CHAT domain-containing protein/lipopolysaccharide biosynthesis regulator YciM